ncbi:VOC family protein [Nocardiopsis trehalosi]|uniref:VOC family protein n=1 Tax=Nocardiopsis trehalosi TaxID=109329 RepID=UPI000832A414|nr:VOC family protein [Nocardiopsis trehalosi]
MTAPAALAMVDLDSGAPRTPAAFYAAVLGWEVVYAEGAYAMIRGEGAPIGSAGSTGYRPPNWPDPEGEKRFHLDLYVDDLDRAEADCTALGATRPDFRPGERRRVLLDPDGRPFRARLRPEAEAS